MKLFRIILLLAFVCVGHDAAAQPAQTPTPPGRPVLNFSDLTSGPKTGNTDVSLGQSAGQDGAIVTVWGTNLGASQGTSRVTVNGADAAKVYYWGPAKPPYSPADLSVRHGMQAVIFAVSGRAADGPGKIVVTVNGRASNELPFTVRPGRIFFVSTSGDDKAGNGAWSRPWRSMPGAVKHMAAGDITYVCDGVKQTGEDAYAAAVNLSLRGSPDRPAAFVAYPGAQVSVGGDDIRKGFGHWLSGFGETDWWVIAKFSVRAHETAVDMGSGWRVVGNFVTAPTGSAPEGAIEGLGNNLFVLGNELTGVGRRGTSKLYHPIYISSARADSGPRLPAESDREIAWNYLHDNNANRAINIYSERKSAAYMSGHRVHDNFIINQVGGGMLLGQYMTGENWVYNNVIADAGLGPEPDDGPAQQHVGVEIEPGVEGGPKTTLYFYNNTICGCGWKDAKLGAYATGNLAIDRLDTYSLVFVNNIIVSTGEPYLPRRGDVTPPRPFDARNLWFGAGPAPRWDLNALSADPLFVNPKSFDFHLKAGSPAVDAGVDVRKVVDHDIENVPRPQGAGFDLGAYEFFRK